MFRSASQIASLPSPDIERGRTTFGGESMTLRLAKLAAPLIGMIIGGLPISGASAQQWRLKLEGRRP